MKLQPAGTMKTTLLAIFCISVFLMAYETSAERRVYMALSPSRTQFWEYETVSVRCEQVDTDEWTVWRYTTSRPHSVSESEDVPVDSGEPVLSRCGSGWGIQTSSSTCKIQAVKLLDSGSYWCESARRGNSEPINITIARKGSAILHSPTLPAAAGNVTLFCEVDGPSSIPTTTFYKEGTVISEGPTNHMTIRNFSESDEGVYSCVIKDHGESPSAWLNLDDDPDPVWLEVEPNSSQLLEYDNVSLSCGENSGFHGWRVIRAISTQISGGQFSLQSCGPRWGVLTPDGCLLQTAKKPDSGLYWCETQTGRRSNMVNFTVYDTKAGLQSPASPVKTGDNITLHCRIKGQHSSRPAAFYKDGYFIGTEPTSNLTIRSVSKSDEGVYKCDIIGLGESPPSWLFVRDAKGTFRSKTSQNLHVLRVLYRLVVIFPYGISTVLLVSLYLHGPAGNVSDQRHGAKGFVSMTMSPPGDNDNERMDQLFDDVIVDVTTEHHF